jgi:hypothetical protein
MGTDDTNVGRHSDREERSTEEAALGVSPSEAIDRGAFVADEPSSHRHALDIDRRTERQPVAGRARTYSIRDTETELLTTIGTFRVVPADDLHRAAESAHRAAADLRHLTEQGLIERHVITINGRSGAVCVLTAEGKALLEAHRQAPLGWRPQQYHAGLVKPRELSHDAQIYRMFRAESDRIAKGRGVVRRIVLDYELKREYQTFLNRRDRSRETDEHADRTAFARQAELPFIDGRVVFPDLRIEYETPEGMLAYRDVELVTEHYSRSQLAGKAAAGFGLYRAAGCRAGRGTTGATPLDPHNLDWLR